MIVHVVLFEPRPDLTDADRRRLVDELGSVALEVAAVRRLRVGRRTRHGLPGYEQMMRDDYSYAAIIEFESIGDLRAYLAHPAHERVGRHFTESSVRALAYDYQMLDAAEAAGLLE